MTVELENLTLRFIVVYRPDGSVCTIQSDDEMKEAKKQMRLDKKVLSIKGKYKVETLTFQEANERGLFGEGPVSV